MNNKGFTLVELLLAAALFLGVLSVFGGLAKQAMRITTSVDESAQALSIVRSELEEIKQKPFAEVLALNGSSFYEGKGKIFVVALSSELLKIKVEINRPAMQFCSLRGKYL